MLRISSPISIKTSKICKVNIKCISGKCDDFLTCSKTVNFACTENLKTGKYFDFQAVNE